MLAKIAYLLIFGKPLIFYLGILTFFSLIMTATIGFMNRRGNHSIPLQWHFIMARITIALAFLHGILAMSAYL